MKQKVCIYIFTIGILIIETSFMLSEVIESSYYIFGIGVVVSLVGGCGVLRFGGWKKICEILEKLGI